MLSSPTEVPLDGVCLMFAHAVCSGYLWQQKQNAGEDLESIGQKLGLISDVKLSG